MTKRVRIENADTASFKVVVQVWDKGPILDPLGATRGPDTLAREIKLDNPCDMAAGDDLYLTSTRYLVVKEA